MLSIRRVPLLIVAATSLTALSGCSGDEGAAESNATAEATVSMRPTYGPVKENDCRADVQLTGAVKASWSGEATVSRGGHEKFASYTTSKGDVTVAILPATDDVPATPIVTSEGETFTVQPKTGKVRVDKKGGGASVDAKAVVVKDGTTRTVTVKATFKC